MWIGANAVICGGVTIGKGSMIGAGSVVTRDIPGNDGGRGAYWMGGIISWQEAPFREFFLNFPEGEVVWLRRLLERKHSDLRKTQQQCPQPLGLQEIPRNKEA